MSTATQVELVTAYAAATVRIREALAAAVDASWLGLGAWREEDIPRYLAQVLPLVNGSLAAMASLTDAYLAALLTDMLGVPVTAALLPAAYPRPGVTPAEVYRRPFVTVWTALSRDVPVTQAVESGRARAVQTAVTDLQLAKRDASQARLAGDDRVVGYRRVLTGSKSCAMCALAATQRYHRSRLMPIHPGCNCAVAPLVAATDPGQRINAAVVRDGAAFEDRGLESRGLTRGELDEVTDTNALHDAIATRFGAEVANRRGLGYRDLVAEHEHGELGPLMTRQGDHFTGPDDI
ncbi:hypothetical protein AB0I61_17305 [Polymorphospora rubra]|uniref:hypothetical protein n=1 Tax=Polymorphospora rubra TaxID=338584 RepID=UPI0033EAD4F0